MKDLISLAVICFFVGSEGVKIYDAVTFNNLGCWSDKIKPRAIPTMEGDSHLDGGYGERINPLVKCARAAYVKGFEVFAIQDGGWCASSQNASSTYRRHGPSNKCNANGEGASLANQVYELKSFSQVTLIKLGCWSDGLVRTIPMIEGLDPILNGGYRSRQDAIAKCVQAAHARGYNVMALQDNGACHAARDAILRYNNYGESDKCGSNGKGGPWANEVYLIRVLQTTNRG